MLFTAEFDPLRDEGREYAAKLIRDGVAVQSVHLDDQMHGFAMQTRVIDAAQKAVADAADFLRDALHHGTS
jgi:acetyl esterase/lipase